MTWLSRLLPQSARLPRLADHNHRTRQGQRRRRMATLETLEGRTLLSNVVVTFRTPTSALTITGDTTTDNHNQNFTITENLDGTVTVAPGATHVVPGVGVVPASTIDGSSKPFTTGSAVTSIIVNLPGTTNFDFVTLTGQGKTTPTTVKNVTVTATGANLTFAANNVDNSGSLVVSDTFTSAVNAVLTATVNNSSFALLSITQTGGGPDSTSVTLGNDNIPASVSVSEGNANGDSITLNSGDTFGTTTLLQGNGGPTNPNSLGNSDTVSVSNSSANNLLIEQLLNGNNNKITVNTLSIAAINPIGLHDGLTTSQGNGDTDITTITGVTTLNNAPPPNLPFPPFYATSNIVVGQGSGSGDSASVTNSTVPGSISITQKDMAVNALGDSATISGDTVGYTETSGTTVLAAFPGNLTISQLNASIDTATVSGSTALGGNVSITQGNGGGTSTNPPGDSATVTGVTAGTLLSNGTIVGGNITIKQGTGSDDSVTVSGSTALGNVSITQTDVAANPFGDSATVSGDTVTGNITILQGYASGDMATIDPTSAGGNVTITQFDGAGDTATADLTTVGGNVTISQGTGSDDTATVGSSLGFTTVGGNITITQGDVAGNATGDTASVLGVTAGSSTGSPFPIEVGGLVTITQGNAPGDVALLNGDHVNNVSITQGDNVQVLNGSTVASDVAEINGTTVTSNIVIIQGTGFSTAPDAGLYVTAIGFDYLGYISGTPASAPVTAGGYTIIDQNYANNQVYLGDATSSFTTNYLDVYTGGGGGAFVFAANTTVFSGALGIFDPLGYTIDGGGLGNTYVDGGGNSGVTVDPATLQLLIPTPSEKQHFTLR